MVKYPPSGHGLEKLPYFYCSELVGVIMPGFGNINRQC